MKKTNKTLISFLLIGLFAIFTLLASSCSSRKGKTQTQFIFMGASFQISSYSGGMLFWASKTDDTAHLIEAIDYSQYKNLLDQTVNLNGELTNGNWNFFAIGWNGSEPLTGDVSCAQVIDKNLSGSDEKISLILENSTCASKVFSLYATTDTKGINRFPKINSINSCKTFPNLPTTLDLSACSENSGNLGFPRSFRIGFQNFRIGDVGTLGRERTTLTIDGSNPIGVMNLMSACLPLPLPGISGPSVTSLNLPTGNDLRFLRTTLNSYWTDDCSGSVISDQLPKGLHNPVNFQNTPHEDLKSFYDSRNSSYNLFIKKLNMAPNSAPSVSNITSHGEFQMITKMYTLNYTDPDGDIATACSVSNLTNATMSTSCACDEEGLCKVGITAQTTAIGSGASFDYTVTTNGVESNTATVTLTIDQIGASINDEWIKVPANAGNMGLDEFYVMKYEARAWMKKDLSAAANEDNVIDAGEVDPDGLGPVTTTVNWVELLDPNAAEGDPTDYLPVSIAMSQPWREINANNAALRCQALGTNYQLISNEHWMAIARDLEAQPQNWTGGAIESGCLSRGNTGETTVGDGLNLGDSCGYNAATDPDSGISRDLRAIHTLSNGSQIYDLAGNVHEWTDWDKDTAGFQLGPKTCQNNGFEQLPVVTCPSLVDYDYLPTNGSYTSIDGIGHFSGGSGGAAVRGGSWGIGVSSGLYTLGLSYTTTYSGSNIGFRCVFTPSTSPQ